MPKAKTATRLEQDLNRWCIEMAMRWPTVRVEPRYSNAIGAQNPYGLPGNVSGGDIEADVIARANKIMAWVKAPH